MGADSHRYIEPGDDAVLLGDDVAVHVRIGGDDAFAGGVATADILVQCARDSLNN